MKRRASNPRDHLISLARYGRLTPDEAETKAASLGWPPFAAQPAFPAFDPIQQPRWSIVMALAWITWRDLEVTREYCAEFRAECTHWIFREWREPIKKGTAFANRKGWFLEQWLPASVSHLALLTSYKKVSEEPPKSPYVSVSDAQRALWQALSEGELVAEALTDAGKPVDIPQREWSYLKLFEERGADVLKLDALDREAAYSKINLKRDDILRLWPRLGRYETVEIPESFPIEPYMLQPMVASGNSGYVPLCSALHWIMTDGGVRKALINDESWAQTLEQVWPLICSNELELIGLPAGKGMTERIEGKSLTLVRVLAPLENSLDAIVVSAPSHISCTPYVDAEHWRKDFNDQLFISGRGGAAWTHLQVSKSQILERWPKGHSTVATEQSCYRWLVAQMNASPKERPRSRAAFLEEARTRFPALAGRQFIRAWDRAISDTGAKNWSKRGRPKKSNRSGS